MHNEGKGGCGTYQDIEEADKAEDPCEVTPVRVAETWIGEHIRLDRSQIKTFLREHRVLCAIIRAYLVHSELPFRECGG